MMVKNARFCSTASRQAAVNAAESCPGMDRENSLNNESFRVYGDCQELKLNRLVEMQRCSHIHCRV